MKWLKFILTLLAAWVRAHTAEKVRKALSAEAKLHREREKLLRVIDLEGRRAVEYGRKAVERSDAAVDAKMKVEEIEKRLELWETKSPS